MTVTLIDGKIDLSVFVVLPAGVEVILEGHGDDWFDGAWFASRYLCVVQPAHTLHQPPTPSDTRRNCINVFLTFLKNTPFLEFSLK